MNFVRPIRFAVFVVSMLLCSRAFSQVVNFSVNVKKDSAIKISPYIYGTNQLLSGVKGEERWGAYRIGGNRLTGYNWENNASNAGMDYFNYSDNYLCNVYNVPADSFNVPGAVTSEFQQQALQMVASSLVTLQMAGFVAKDKDGDSVTVAQTAPSPRWAYVKFHKSGPLSLVPDTSDDSVFMDEYVNFLVHKFGPADSTTGVKAFELDNEPSLWNQTHPRIHPEQTTCAEIIDKSVALAGTVKEIDSSALVFGPALYGFNAYYSFQNAPDWNSMRASKGYSWFIDYYLDRMKQASDSAGKRLLDVLDLHWYPEAIGDHRITDAAATTHKDDSARVEAPRTLWDPNYRENSWIAQYNSSFLPLIPRVMQSIDKYYPGTKLAFTEFSYGGEDDISGALAIDDVLGIFAKYGAFFASYWDLASPAPYISAAYEMYRNYNGEDSAFGGYYVPSQTSDNTNSSIYGSVDDGDSEIHLIVINKNLSSPITGNFTISCPEQIVSGEVWELDGSSANIVRAPDVTDISNNTFAYTLPKESVLHFVLKTSGTINSVVERNVPKQYLLSSYPNPFNPSCRIAYSVPDNSVSGIRIYSVTGELVKTFTGLSHSGIISWDATNDIGERVASGVYFAILGNSGHLYGATKMLLLK